MTNAAELPPILLIVDDDRGIRRVIRRALRHERLDVFEWASAEEALAALTVPPWPDAASRPPAILLADLRLQHSDGLALLRRAHTLLPETTRILLSAFLDLRLVQAALRDQTIHLVLAKPWEPGQLNAVIKRGLQIHAELSAARRVLSDVAVRAYATWRDARQLLDASKPEVLHGATVEAAASPAGQVPGLRLAADTTTSGETPPADSAGSLAGLQPAPPPRPHANPAAKLPLSRREIEVVTLLCQDLDTGMVARRMGIARRTVLMHQQRVLARLHLPGLAALVKWAIRAGLTELE